ncbi:hypothetical protein MASR2M74_10650 [Paracoccaceae bacterium]
MTYLRSLLFGFLVVALLPWGAWLSDRGTAPREPAAVLQQAAPALLQAAHRCRIALLPGQGCGMDLALLPAQAEQTAPGGTKAALPLSLLLKAAVLADTVTPPPRAV